MSATKELAKRVLLPGALLESDRKEIATALDRLHAYETAGGDAAPIPRPAHLNRTERSTTDGGGMTCVFWTSGKRSEA
jgi:hypothetical protein